MAGITAKKIIDALPASATMSLPSGWFDKLPDDVSVFESLYRWMVDRGATADRLHNRTYAGAGVARKLRSAERRRIQRVHKLRGEELENAVSWSDLNSGPQTLFANLVVQGDVLVVVRDVDRPRVDQLMSQLYRSGWEARTRKIRELASGATFVEWLMANAGREDPIGDLVKDMEHDANFPRGATRFEEMRRHAYTTSYSPWWLEALNDAWLEYADKYPDRLPRTAWCDVCDGQIAQGADGALVWASESELVLAHLRCLAVDDDDPKLGLSELLTRNRPLEALADFCEQHDVPSWTAKELEKKLRTSGLTSEREPTIVYFVQSGESGPIKIGYSAGPVERRLASLKTAHPEKLHVLATMAGDRATEADLHLKFAAHRKQGEWFEPHPDLIAFIAVLKKP